MFGVLALLCIMLGFVGAIIDEMILLGALEWFVAAIAFNTLTVAVPKPPAWRNR